ncbi:hypothetical protein HELRODRAFT_167002 [Helobdella robusta]|uniref:Uncharacterized protein n=1 Tax=Helobdella robusta TaxID=6412 RepID=T1EYV6_HELRO|nr:hypothetical protein HELRODRAFT_167002 [Helobdella robusta]ESO11909.1 hypothetical protein HELRODRAFT_167002 [Helobdella robusta]
MDLFKPGNQLNVRSENIKRIQENNEVICNQVMEVKNNHEKKILTMNLEIKISTLHEKIKTERIYRTVTTSLVVKLKIFKQCLKKITGDDLEGKINLFQDNLKRSYADAVKEVKEDNKLNFNGSKKEDEEKYLKIFSTVIDERVDKPDVVKRYRLSKRQAVVGYIEIKDDDLKRIGIDHDLAKDPRSEFKKLMQVAKEEDAADKQDFVYNVKGKPGNLRII